MDEGDDKRVAGKSYATQFEPKNAKTGVLATWSMPILQRQWRSWALVTGMCNARFDMSSHG